MRILFLAVIFFFSACTKLNFGYRLAPRSMMSKLDDTFDFKSDRFKQVRSQLDVDFKSNRTQVAKAVLNHVDEILLLVSKNEASENDFKTLMNSMQSSRILLISLFKNSFATVINDLTSKEIKNLDEFSNKKFKEQDKKISEKNNYQEKQMSSFENVMDFLFDSVNKDQLAIYNQFINQHHDFYVKQLGFRKEFSKKFDTLADKKSELLIYVMNYYAGDPSVRSPEQQKQLEDFAAELHKMMLKVWNASTPKQKDKLKENMQDFQIELKEMMEDQN